MKHPTIKQLDFVIGKLKSVAPQAIKEGAFDMAIGSVYSNGLNYDGHPSSLYACGTVHCTGGWYVFANLERGFIKDKHDAGFIYYKDGALLMARDLGFESISDLLTWASQNPNIWGNMNGGAIFYLEGAYNNPSFAGVVKQFEIVRSNLMKLKEK